MARQTQPILGPLIRRLTINRFRGIESLTWWPAPGLNVILGGGDVGKSTILDAIALLLSPSTANTLFDVDFMGRDTQPGFQIEAIMSLPEICGINAQSKQNWPWHWDGKNPCMPNLDSETPTEEDPVYVLSACANADFELFHQVLQPNDEVGSLSVGVRRAIGLVRLGGDDRNDRDLRLVQGSALDRLLSDKTLRSRLGLILSTEDVDKPLAYLFQ
jgi:putative ATP-dependent endonuclease of OLD family